MSFPHIVLKATTTSNLKISSNDSAIAGVEDPAYLITSKKLPIVQLSRLLEQLTTLSTYSQDLLTSLTNDSIKISNRIHSINSRIDKLMDNYPNFERNVQNQEQKSYQPPKIIWNSNNTIQSNFFTTHSRPKFINDLFDLCSPIPPLTDLDKFRQDGLSCRKLFSYPDFFVEEWKVLIRKHEEEKKLKRKNRLNNDKLTNDIISRTSIPVQPNAHTIGHSSMNQPKQPKTRLEKSKSTSLGSILNRTSDIFEKPSRVGSNNNVQPPIPPPPPPPPIVKIHNSLQSKNATNEIIPLTESPLQTQVIISTIPTKKIIPSDRSNLLGEIRSKQFVLKKVTRLEPKQIKNTNDVAEILMRRALALKDSDSDLENDPDDDDWR
ncbi:hypothetical protein BC833DRAFT_608387 [Globomyces pollinis-pini]|nr:hypothetical protein BC833DRAFT_608387 [Globomyces pollinis-pini]